MFDSTAAAYGLYQQYLVRSERHGLLAAAMQEEAISYPLNTPEHRKCLDLVTRFRERQSVLSLRAHQLQVELQKRSRHAA